MDLEQSKSWLSLAQQPYPLVNNFLLSINSKASDTEITVLLQQFLNDNQATIDQSQLNKSLNWLAYPNHHLMAFINFPEPLKSINSPPAVLFLAGDESLVHAQHIAIVGSRKPTSSGRENAIYFSRVLANYGLGIISGLASGIDGLVHQAALDVNGKTLAVLGCGHNTIYPSIHHQLQKSIEAEGLTISEFTPDTPVRAYQFPRRNRIISGLSLGVLVVEAAIKSGSLITCRLAAEQGREVFAIPGDITNPMARGCHHLIRHGACLVNDPEDILSELNVDLFGKINPLEGKVTSEYPKNLSKIEMILMDSLSRHPVSLDRIVNRSGLEMPLVLSILFKLELRKMVISTADGYFKNSNI